MKNLFFALIVICILLREEITLMMLYVKEETTFFGLSLENAAFWSHTLAVFAILSLVGYLRSKD